MNTPTDAAVPADKAEMSGTLLARFKHVDRYRGLPSFLGYIDAVGTLSVFDDRLEFHKSEGATCLANGGNSGDIFSIISAICELVYNKVTAHDETDVPGEICFLDEIAELREDRHMGVQRILVVTQKSGDVWSFHFSSKSIPKQIIQLLKPYSG